MNVIYHRRITFWFTVFWMYLQVYVYDHSYVRDFFSNVLLLIRC